MPTAGDVKAGVQNVFSDNWVAQRGNADYSRLEIGAPVEI